jgi:autotransporter-associated beta strand protein
LWDDPVPVFDVADITKDEQPDFILRHAVLDRCSHRYTSAQNWATYHSSGFVKRGPGTMCLDMKNNEFSGPVTVEEGVLMLGKGGTDNGDPGNGTVARSFLGNLTSNRTITVAAGATLDVSRRNTFGNYSPYTNDMVKVNFIVRGTLKLSQTGGATRLPSVTFDGGSFGFPATGAKEYGVTMFAGTASLTGETAHVWNPHEGGFYQWINLSGLPQTTFDVADITGDGAADMTLGLPLTVPGNAQKNGVVMNGWRFGFTKTGAGTLRYTAGHPIIQTVNLSFNGDVTVSNGTFLVDGDISRSDTIRVSEGAFVGGTGVVHHVSIASGGGFAAAAENGAGLAVTGDLTMPESGRVDLVFAGAPSTRRMVTVARVAGTLTAPASLDGWTVLLDGGPAPASFGIVARDGVIRAGYWAGTTLILR